MSEFTNSVDAPAPIPEPAPKPKRERLPGSPITVRVELTEEAARGYLKRYDPREEVSPKDVRGALMPILEGAAAKGARDQIEALQQKYREGYAKWALDGAREAGLIGSEG